MLNIAAAVERAAEFDIIHYEAAYYPMSLAFSRLSPTPLVQTLHHAPSRGRSRAVAALSRGAVHRHLATSRRGCCRAQRRRHGACTASTPTASTSGDTPDDYLLFLGRFTEGKGVLQAIEVAQRVGMKLLLAAAENDYYRDARRAARRRHADRRTSAKPTSTPRCGCTAARARCSIRCRRASRSGWCSPRRWPAARRSPRSIAARSAKSSTTASPACVFDDLDAMVGGLPRVLALDRRRVRDRAVDAVRRRPHGRRVRRRVSARHRRRTVAVSPDDASPVSPDGPCSPSSRIQTTSRWPAAARSPGWPTPAPASSSCARRTASAAARPGPVRDDALGARARRRSCAAPRPRSASPTSSSVDHPDGDLRWAHVAEFHAELVAVIRRYAPAAVITFGEDGLYWHLDHVGVYERTTTAVRLARRRRRRRSTT